jgi:hypothetical protein
MKLSKTQQDIIDLLVDGWEMGWSRTLDGGVWIQKGGAGRGGESRKVNINTAKALLKMGQIRCVENGYPTARYRLTPNVELRGAARLYRAASRLSAGLELYCETSAMNSGERTTLPTKF